MISVFYDGKCGLCRREIEHYKRIAPEGVFEWVDITVDTSVTQKLGISYTDGLKLLHAQDSNGKLHVGVDAFLLIWQQIPRWRKVATMVFSAFDTTCGQLCLPGIRCMAFPAACPLPNRHKSR